jgi:uncharacterized cysteine cluster protein YcgN (CxxCxxCC family)
MEITAYDLYLAAKEKEYESLCLMCGKCCGSLNDPCEHLEKTGPASYRCRIYNNRLGQHKTIRGNVFNCVPIKELLKKSAMPPDCAYAKTIRL